MNQFNYKNWSMQQEIQKRVNVEAEKTWGQQNDRPIIPKFQKSKVVRKNVGWYNFCQLVRQLNP